MKNRYIIAGIFTGIILQTTHHIWLGSHKDYHFDLMILLIIFICGFFLSLKLTSYMADFKNIKEKSRIEIVFLSIFFILAILPALYINPDDISKQENRMLTTYKPLISNDRVNASFGKDFENYFNDRFYCRNTLIAFNDFFKTLLSYKYSRNKDVVYIKSNNFMSRLLNELLIEKPEISNNINKLQEFSIKNDIKLYIIIVPEKPSIYNDLLKPFNNNNVVDDNNKKIQNLIYNTNAKIIYPFNELKEGSKLNWVYFKTDHHWTDTGAFIGYKCLIKEISKDLPNIKQLRKEDFDIKYDKLVRSDFNRDFHMGQTLKKFFPNFKHKKTILDTQYEYFYYKNSKNLKEKVINIPNKRGKITHYSNGANYKILEIGTSMNENLMPFISYSFKDVKYIRLNNVKNRKQEDEFKIMKYYKKEILDYKPDIMIFCLTVGNLENISKIFDEE